MIDLMVSGDAEPRQAGRRILGIFPGEGIGPEVIGAALRVLDAAEAVGGVHLTRLTFAADGSGAGRAPADAGQLPADVAGFCAQVFAQGGALLCGPVGGRFVYDLRRRFDLFCKLAPIKPQPALYHAARLKPEILHGVDMVIVRDNAAGVYQGRWADRTDPQLGRVAEHWFSYSQKDVERIVAVGVRLARQRRKQLHVVLKEGGIPAISALWRDVAAQGVEQTGVHCVLINVDHAAYRMMQHPEEFDVLVTPNMIGDILADLGAVFLGSRGMSYTANFSADGKAVYQTGHGAACDLAGTDRANPLAQILALAMLLRQSAALPEAAALIESAVDAVLRAGWRTDDLWVAGCRRAGTRQMGELVTQAILARAPAKAGA